MILTLIRAFKQLFTQLLKQINSSFRLKGDSYHIETFLTNLAEFFTQNYKQFYFLFISIWNLKEQ